MRSGDKKLYLNSTKKHLVSLSAGTEVFTSLAYRQDYKRRGLQELKHHGYFEQLGRFHFKRTNKTYDKTN